MKSYILRLLSIVYHSQTCYIHLLFSSFVGLIDDDLSCLLRTSKLDAERKLKKRELF